MKSCRPPLFRNRQFVSLHGTHAITGSNPITGILKTAASDAATGDGVGGDSGIEAVPAAIASVAESEYPPASAAAPYGVGGVYMSRIRNVR
jgi:hypothetical protein